MDRQTWLELVLWATICYRLVNRISTFEDFGGIPEIEEWPRFRTFLRKKDSDPHKKEALFTDAHFAAGIKAYVPNMDTLHKKNGKALKEVSKSLLGCCQNGSLDECFDQMTTINGIGSFLGWQTTCDLMESKCLEPFDENDWTKLGPGAEGNSQHRFLPCFYGWLFSLVHSLLS